MRARAECQPLVSRSRATDCNTAGERVVVACSESHPAAPLSGWHGGLHIHEPSQRIRAVATALRTSQHHDLLHVEQGRERADTAEIDVVDQETD